MEDRSRARARRRELARDVFRRQPDGDSDAAQQQQAKNSPARRRQQQQREEGGGAPRAGAGAPEARAGPASAGAHGIRAQLALNGVTAGGGTDADASLLERPMERSSPAHPPPRRLLRPVPAIAELRAARQLMRAPSGDGGAREEKGVDAIAQTLDGVVVFPRRRSGTAPAPAPAPALHPRPRWPAPAVVEDAYADDGRARQASTRRSRGALSEGDADRFTDAIASGR